MPFEAAVLSRPALRWNDPGAGWATTRRVIDLIDLPREEVIGLVRKLMQCDPLFDFKILEALQNTGGQHPVGNLEIVRALRTSSMPYPST